MGVSPSGDPKLGALEKLWNDCGADVESVFEKLGEDPKKALK